MTTPDLEQTLASLAARYADVLGADSALRVSFLVNDDGDLCVRLLVYDGETLLEGTEFSWGRPLEQLDFQSPRLNAFLDAHIQLSRELMDLNEPDNPMVREGFEPGLLDDDQLQTAEDFLRAIKDHLRFDLHMEPDPEARHTRWNLQKTLTGPQPSLFALLESVTPDQMELGDVLAKVREELDALPAEQRADLTPWLITTFDNLLGARHLDTQVRHKGKRVFYKDTVAVELGRFYEQWNGIPLVPTSEM
ncbi:hypothetical protein LY474_36345 [Myxococcus stipitatus]|uniref:hypothetical protein n=1 Tax=Myxococcus stipitatus TaxID=83455 RepID=UPI001F3DBD31|nr:hypothetical protein [Myxococcus stipitatus]MCE9673293.1 hypothetical protein [Myxococcus stipitatus]